MSNILVKITRPIIILGIFLICIFAALNYENLTASFYIIFFIVAIFIFLFGFAIGQRFASPVKKLVERATALAEGALKTRVYLETKDEFEQLSKIFNKIAEELEKSQSTAEQAEDIAEVKIRAKTQELEEVVANLEEKIRGRNTELQRMIEESEKLQGVAKERETEVIKLKKEIKELKEALNNNKSKRGKPVAGKP